MKFLEAIEIFNSFRRLKVKEINGYDKDLRSFAIYVHDKSIEEISDIDIIEWLEYHKLMGYKFSSLIKKEEALIQFFKLFKRKGFDVLDPYLIPITPKEFVAPRICIELDYLKLLSAIKEKTNSFSEIRNRAMINLIWNTGMRIGECVALNVSDLDLERKLVKIKTEKSRGVRPFRVLPYNIFDNRAEKSLDCWIERREQLIKTIPLDEPDTLFFGVKCGKTRGKRLLASCVGEIFRKISHRAKIEIVNPHSFRHHFGNELARKGFNNSIISEAMGHSSLNSSYRYTQLENSELTNTLRGGY
jgi:integrase/recombinase XerC